LILAACGGTQTEPQGPRNEGGAAMPAPDASLRGPFARVEDAPYLKGDEPLRVRTIARADGPIAVSLVEVRSTESAAECVVALETAAGLYTGEDFLCDAFRSDEVITTDDVHVAIDGEVATLRFRTSYSLDQGEPQFEQHEITCTLGGTLSCTAPPSMGYESSFSQMP
jgi:hypothetical protein